MWQNIRAENTVCLQFYNNIYMVNKSGHAFKYQWTMTVLCNSHGSVVKVNGWFVIFFVAVFFFTYFQLMPWTVTPHIKS